ncbi:MAG: hypothetical protein JO303_05610 [Caulobacteraceae bacterium]|nr:hypothetical protein [Caulobacteraceae bacterium]
MKRQTAAIEAASVAEPPSADAGVQLDAALHSLYRRRLAEPAPDHLLAHVDRLERGGAEGPSN